MASTRKKVLLRTHRHAVQAGYLPATGFVDTDGDMLGLLDLEGRFRQVPLAEIRMVSFVREFNLSDKEQPEGLLRRTFPARPRAEGLWLRLTLRAPDGVSSQSLTYEPEVLEGLAPLDLSLADGLVMDRGVFLTPPDTRGNTQRLYIPRLALTGLEVLAVITSPGRSRAAQRLAAGSLQNDLFPPRL